MFEEDNLRENPYDPRDRNIYLGFAALFMTFIGGIAVGVLLS